ncbi:hypothetical protein HHI36_007768 [Cryptolaemus montrouzieri]|uniref:Uncharacterized protein n=1 Tax=Cryptolaemus montrouzieri TaxID=559131 RepID=A0ABD2MQJ1_9CUCU
MHRTQLFHVVIAEIPHVKEFTEQRIADQRRVIILNNLLPNVIVRQIKDEVEAELNILHHAQGSPPPDEEPSTASEDNNYDTKNEVPAPDCESVWVSNCKRHLIECLGMDPNKLPGLPKIAYKLGLNLPLKEANEAICYDLTNLEKIHLRMYCAALTTIEQSGLKINTEAKFYSSKTEIPAW